MKKLLVAALALGFAVTSNAVLVVDDSFDTLSNPPWNQTGGFFHTGDAVLLSTFGGGWAQAGNSGTGILNSNVGRASFDIADPGEAGITVGGFFQIGDGNYANNGFAVANINLSLEGAGNYQLVWNNSGTSESFDFLDGSVVGGTINGDSFGWRVDAGAWHWGTPTSAANVVSGDAGTTFGFYNVSATAKSVIDNVKIDTALVPEPATFGLLGLAGAGIFVTRRMRMI